MPSRDSASAIQEIKSRLSIVDKIQRTVSLQKMGKNYRGLCPFHGEKTPSFYVWPGEGGSYHCFGCGRSGDIFNFVMETQGLPFGDALRELAQEAGVELPERTRTSEADRRLDRLRQLLTTAADYFHDLLLKSPAAEQARSYIQERGVNASGVTMFHLGYSLDSWDALLTYLRERDYTAEEIRDVGLVKEREGGGYYDTFRGRLMFPVRDIRGQVVGFGSRTLKAEEKPKYMNSVQTVLFDKSNILYGIDLARAQIKTGNQAVIVEGYFDALIAHQHGLSNVVAGLGTALGEKQVAILKKLTRNIVIALDADAAGDMAALKEAENLRQGMDYLAIPVYSPRGLVGYEYKLDASIRIAVLPKGQDPDEVIRRSVEEWQAIIAKAKPVVEHYFDLVMTANDLSTAVGKREAVRQLAPLIASVGDAVERSHYTQELALLVRAPLEAVQQTIASHSSRPQRARPQPSSPDSEAGEASEATEEPVKKRPARRTTAAMLEDTILAFLLRYPQCVHGNVAPEFRDFSRTEVRLLYAALQEQDAATLLADRRNSTVEPYQSGNTIGDKGLDSGDTIVNDGSNLPYPMLSSQLEPVLRDEMQHLWRNGTQEPELYGPDVERSLADRLKRLRKARDEHWFRIQSQIMAEAEKEQDTATLQSLTSEVSSRYPELRNYNPPPSTVIRDSRDGKVLILR